MQSALRLHRYTNFSQGANTRSVVEERLKGILDFIDFHMKRVCEKDKAIVLARARTEGIPQLPGPWAMEEERFQNGGGNRWASFSTIQRSCSMDTTCSSVGKTTHVFYHVLHSFPSFQLNYPIFH